MKQLIYNGDMGPNITIGGIPFTAGEIVEVNDDALADELLRKPNLSEAPPVVTTSGKSVKAAADPVIINP